MKAPPNSHPQEDGGKQIAQATNHLDGIPFKKKPILRVDTNELEANNASRQDASPNKGMMSPTVAYYPGAYNPPSVRETDGAERYKKYALLVVIINCDDNLVFFVFRHSVSKFRGDDGDLEMQRPRSKSKYMSSPLGAIRSTLQSSKSSPSIDSGRNRSATLLQSTKSFFL